MGLDGGDEVGGDDPGALVDQLVESVLAVGARLAPHYGSCLVVHCTTTARHVPAARPQSCLQHTQPLPALYDVSTKYDKHLKHTEAVLLTFH